MKTHRACTYWYEISMHVDRKGNGVHIPTLIRIPVRCEIPREQSSVCIYLNPSSATVESKEILNEHLFDSPIKCRTII